MPDEPTVPCTRPDGDGTRVNAEAMPQGKAPEFVEHRNPASAPAQWGRRGGAPIVSDSR